MALPTSSKDLSAWVDYRVYLKQELKRLEDGDHALFVSKEKLTFDVRGTPWKGHAFLLGPKSELVHKALRKEGLLFRRATCRRAGRKLSAADLSPQLAKQWRRTLVKLQLGWGRPAGGRRRRRRGPAEPPVEEAGALPGGSGKKDGPQKDEDLVDQLVEDVIGDPEKRLKALAKWRVPNLSEEYASDTPESRFLHDLKSGTERIKKNIDYVNTAFEYHEKYGQHVGAAELNGALRGIKKVSGKLAGGLKSVAGKLGSARDAVRWLSAANAFADASAHFDPQDRKTVEHWVGSIKVLSSATEPFVEWASGKAVAAAFAGSRAAAVFGAALGLVLVQLKLGIKTLEAGVKNVNAYLDRLETWDARIDAASAGVGPPAPAPPQAPADWTSRQEQADAARAREDYLLRSRVAADHEARVRKAEQTFEADVFPLLYVRWRPRLQRAILGALRGRGASTGEAQAQMRWWGCFLDRQAEPRWDERSGVELQPKKARVSEVEARQELVNFRNVRPRCPELDTYRERQRARYVAREVPLGR